MSLRLMMIACAALFVGQTALAEPARRPNILWLIGDDLGPELGCYGTGQVWTPNVDRLAAEGTRYTRFYTTAPVCSASRSAFMTGMYQITIGAHNHRSHRDESFPLPAGVRVLTEWFRDAGYYTANVVDLPKGVSARGTGKTDWNFDMPAQPFDTGHWSDLKSHQPFFAQVNFRRPHRPFRVPPRADPAKVAIPPYYPDHAVTRADMAEYLDSVSEWDAEVGQVLGQLRKDGLAENTVVVVFGDNGQPHVRAKQFCYEEGLHVPLLIRWPKEFPAPKQLRAGSVDDRLLAAIDLAPTMLAIGGVEKPSRMEGQVFLGDRAAPPRQYVFGARDRCDETVFRLRTVRDERYRYIRNFTPERPFLQANAYKERSYPVWNLLKELHAAGKLAPAQDVLCAPTMPAEELYDLQADPHEIHNLAGSAEHRADMERLRAALTGWIEQTHDQGQQLEPPAVVEKASKPAKAKPPRRAAK